MAKHLGDEGRKISAHSLRKFHSTELESEMNSSWIVKLQGKNLGGGWAPYSHPEGDGETFDPEKLTEAYCRAYKVLRIKDSKTQQDKERDKKFSEQEKRIKELEADSLELTELRTQMEEIMRNQEKRASHEEVMMSEIQSITEQLHKINREKRKR